MTPVATTQVIRTPDDRTIEILAMPPAHGWTLIFQPGTPMGLVSYAPFEVAAAKRGIRLVQYARPGYGGSERRQGRKVADAALDVSYILDHLGVQRGLVLGWSGGGPHALGCAALLPGRVAAAATIASDSPYGAEGVDWLAGSVRSERTASVETATAGSDALRAHIESRAASLATLTGAQLTEAPSAVMDDKTLDGRPEAESAVLVGEYAEYVAASLRRGVEAGIWGWYDDCLAFVNHWGFDPGAIQVPVTVWHGEADRLAPVAHGRWLAATIPGVRARILPDHGHSSITAVYFERILDDLLERAGG